jgi:hydroxymethylglutaryl-CoA lyase
MYLQPLFFRKLAGRKVTVHEGLLRCASEQKHVPSSTVDKIALINLLSRSGLISIESPAFCSSQESLHDAAAVLTHIERVPGVIYSTVVSDVDGAERALDCGADQIRLVVSASESENRRSARNTVTQSAMHLKNVIHAIQGRASIDVSITAAFGCAIEGTVDEEEVLNLGDWFVLQGVNGITLCDTAGVAYPSQIENFCDCLVDRWKEIDLGLELHNQHGLAPVNVIAGMSVGINRFSGSIAPRGSMAEVGHTMLDTRQLIALLEGIGCSPGIQVPLLAK